MDRSNAGQRILSSKRTLMGAEDALENYISHSLQDGCQCFVLEEQANYRFLAASQLKPDGKYVVSSHTRGPGRWVRESGLVGFALLEGGKCGKEGVVGGFTYQQAVQFEVRDDGLLYVGTVPRLAQFFASSPQVLSLRILLIQGEARVVASSNMCSAAGAALLHPGDRIVAVAPGEHPQEQPPAEATVSLQVILT